MYDFTNYQIADIPIFMWSMVAVTTALIAYVTVKNPSNMSAIGAAPPTPVATSSPETMMGGKRKHKSKRNKQSPPCKTRRS